jgi:Cu/Ag efflux protein CusF
MNKDTRGIFSIVAMAASATLLAATSAIAAQAASTAQGASMAQDKPAATMTTSDTATATVTKVDRESRWLTLKREDGVLIDVQAGPEVKNFAQIKVGDKVIATQQNTVTIEVVPAGQAAPNVSSGSKTVSAPAGSKPMGVQADTVTVSGKVTAIDYGKRTVTLQGPHGNLHSFVVGPEAKKFDAVKVGDVAVMTVKTLTSIEVQSPK